MMKDLGKVSCPHFYLSGGKSYVAYAKEGIVYRLDLASGERKKLCYGDEYLPVGNGKFLLRTGQTYVQTGELQ